LFHFLNVLVPTGFVLVGQKIIIIWVTWQIWLLLVKQYKHRYRDPPEKNGLLVSRLSRSLKVIGNDTDQSGT